MKLEEFNGELEFTRFMKAEGLNLRTYFLKYYNKRDLHTGEPIPYNNKKQYLRQDFVDKRNISAWMKTRSKREIEEYLVEKIRERMSEYEEIQYSFGQVECRSIKEFPAINRSIQYVNWVGVCIQAGLRPRFCYELETKARAEDKSKLVYIDTREQKPLRFKNFEIRKLAYGDYTFENFDSVFIERKSIEDLWGTMSGGFDRFCKEIERAKEDGAYIIVTVEYPLTKALSYNFNKKFSKATPEFIFSRIKTIMQKFNNIQFAFTGGRSASLNFIHWVGEVGRDVERYDIQYLIDTKSIEL